MKGRAASSGEFNTEQLAQAEASEAYCEDGFFDESVNNGDKRSKKKRTGSLYWKKYCPSWETDPLLKDWILPNPDDPGKAICRFCETLLRAHRTDLTLHGKTKKHQKCAMAYKSKGKNESIVITVPKRYREKKMKTEVIDKTEEPMENYEADGEMLASVDEAIQQKSSLFSNSYRMKQSGQYLSYLNEKIMAVVSEDMQKLLRREPKLADYLDDCYDEEDSIKKLVRICVGQLAQAYLVDSTVEAYRAKRNSGAMLGRDTSLNTIKTLEETMWQTFSEIKMLKTSLVEQQQLGEQPQVSSIDEITSTATAFIPDSNIIIHS